MNTHTITLSCNYYYVPINNILKSVNLEFCSDAYPHVVYSSHATLKSNPHSHFQNEQNKTKPDDNAGGDRSGDACLPLLTTLGWSLFGSDPCVDLSVSPDPPVAHMDTLHPTGIQTPTHRHSPGRAAQWMARVIRKKRNSLLEPPASFPPPRPRPHE